MRVVATSQGGQQGVRNDGGDITGDNEQFDNNNKLETIQPFVHHL